MWGFKKTVAKKLKKMEANMVTKTQFDDQFALLNDAIAKVLANQGLSLADQQDVFEKVKAATNTLAAALPPVVQNK